MEEILGFLGIPQDAFEGLSLKVRYRTIPAFFMKEIVDAGQYNG
jgi:hypothetical protein